MNTAELMKKWDAGRNSMTLTSRKTEFEFLGKVVIPQLLVAGETVTIPGVGRLKVKTRKGRVARNPRTGEQITVPAKQVAVLVMDKELEKVLNK